MVRALAFTAAGVLACIVTGFSVADAVPTGFGSVLCFRLVFTAFGMLGLMLVLDLLFCPPTLSD